MLDYIWNHIDLEVVYVHKPFWIHQKLTAFQEPFWQIIIAGKNNEIIDFCQSNKRNKTPLKYLNKQT